MTQKQLAAALKLLAHLESDIELKAQSKVYGDWGAHLTDHVKEQLEED